MTNSLDDMIVNREKSGFSRMVFDVGRLEWSDQVVGSQIVKKTKLYYTFSKFQQEREMRYWSIVTLRSSLSRLDFFSLGWTEQHLNWPGETPVDEDRLMMLVMVGSKEIIRTLFQKRSIGIGSRSQLVSEEWDRRFSTTSLLTGVKHEKLEGVNGAGIWGEVDMWLDRRLVWSLWILSKKNWAKDWDKELKESQLGKASGVERWRSLLILVQSWRGFEMEDEIREEL